MNTDSHELIQRYIAGTITDEEARTLQDALKRDAELADLYLSYVNLDVALEAKAEAVEMTSAADRVIVPQAMRWTNWPSWRPLTAAAAGILFGMFCTSVVYGFVARRVVKVVPLAVYDPGLENAEAIMDKGVPHGAGQWGADSAAVVTAENGVQPPQGKRMLRLEPIPREKNVKNLPSRAYQVIDLRSLPMHGIAGDAEVRVTASFCAANADATSRYLVRAFALNETPEQATQGFWPKTQEDGVVSVAQRFETSAGDRGWHTFSLKMPLPRGAQSLVFILGAGPADDASAETSVHYVDDVHVSVLIPQAPLP